MKQVHVLIGRWACCDQRLAGTSPCVHGSRGRYLLIQGSQWLYRTKLLWIFDLRSLTPRNPREGEASISYLDFCCQANAERLDICKHTSAWRELGFLIISFDITNVWCQRSHIVTTGEVLENDLLQLEALLPREQWGSDRCLTQEERKHLYFVFKFNSLWKM